MSRFRKLILLVVVFALLVGGYFIAKNVKEKKANEKKDENLQKKVMVTETKKDDIVEMQLKSDKGTIEFKKQDNKWVIVGCESLDIDENKIQDIARSFSSMSAERVVKKNYGKDVDLSKYGLKKPAVVATATLKDGSKIVLDLGNKTPDNRNYYIMKQGVPNVYTVWMNHGNYLSYTLEDFRNTKLENVDTKKLSYLYIKNEGKEPIEIVANDKQDEQLKSYGLGLWLLTKPYDKPRNVDSNGYGELIKAIPTFKIEKFIDDNPTDLAKYGLDKPKLEIKLIEKDPKTKKTKQVHYLFGNKFNEKYVYFKSDDKNDVYAMKNDFMEKLNIEPFKLAEKLVYIVNIDLVKKIDVKAKDKKYTLTIEKETKKAKKEGEKDEVIDKFKINGKIAEDKPFRKVYQGIIGVAADFELTKKIDLSSKQNEKVEIKYYLNNGTEKVVEYYPYDDNFYITEIQPNIYFACSNDQINEMLKLLDQLEKGELKE